MKGKNGTMSIKVFFYAILVFFFSWYMLCLALKKKREQKVISYVEVAIKSYPTVLHFVDICHFTISTFASFAEKGEGIRPLK